MTTLVLLQVALHGMVCPLLLGTVSNKPCFQRQLSVSAIVAQLILKTLGTF